MAAHARRTLVAVPQTNAAPGQDEIKPTFLIFKYQHTVGKEIDDCLGDGTASKCHSHFQLDFTGSSIALDADIETGLGFQPVWYSAKGKNSTRSFIDLEIRVANGQAEIRNREDRQTVSLPPRFFTLQQDVPFIAQELLLDYWRAHGSPDRIALLPKGEVRVRERGITRLADSNSGTLTRLSVHGITWGDETVWLTDKGRVVAIVGTDAEEDRIEVVRPDLRTDLKKFVDEAASDAVLDLEAAARATKPIASGTFAIVHGTVINPETKEPPQSDVAVLVSDGEVAAVGVNVPIPRGTKTIDATGKFILPGLWDTHAHFEQWEWGPAYLASGVTSVRDVGNEIEFLVPIRRSLNSGRGLGPEMRAAGLIDSDPGSLTSEHAEDAEHARAIVRRYHELGYEQIKIYQSLKPELIPIVADEAHRLGMSVTGHIPTGTDALTAVRAGMDQINHISFVTRVMRPAGATSVKLDSSEAQSAIRLLVEHRTVVEPTLARSEFNGHPQRLSFADIEPSVHWLPPELAIILNNSGISQDREERVAASFQAQLDTTRFLHSAGVPLLAGSDQVVPGFSIHRELELLVRAGLTPLEALRTATVVPAKILGATDSATIAPGRKADLIVLDANPLDNISNIRRVHLTIRSGRAYDPNLLRKLVDISTSQEGN
ncbi:MAG TPA: amidohydrolase family protein [Candidatus Acidoferrales bacterium]|nr:amidohydrolase family protein [Candidatus Acidoferrales bacterium]